MNDPRLRRHECGFYEVVVKPTASELNDYYANRYFQSEAGSYRKSYRPEELHVVQMKIAQRANRAGDFLEDSSLSRRRLLDVGCGEGYVLAWFQQHGWVVEGIDYSTAGVLAMNPAVSDKVEQGNVFHLLERRMASSERYHVVWLGNVLEHVIEPVALLQKLRQLVELKGVLVVTVPNDFSLLQEDLVARGDVSERFWIALPDHLSYFDAESLKCVAEATGWHCRDLQADFPIDLFLTHDGSNYVRNRALGPAAHRARIRLESLIGSRGTERANRFYSALAEVGLGRNLTAFLSPA
jgi:2-polyprenyl-3-methyl-5-hydroxy-6-metoxy-1,4-benzoquinol methylase